jgi:hypothetical protein
MALWENRGPARRAELEELAPGTDLRARIDRGAWAAFSQEAPGTWSWPRAAGTIVLAAVVALIVFVTVYSDVAWVIGLALAYALLLWRARAVHSAYLRRSGS